MNRKDYERLQALARRVVGADDYLYDTAYDAGVTQRFELGTESWALTERAMVRAVKQARRRGSLMEPYNEK